MSYRVPLQLAKYNVKKISLEFNPDYDPEKHGDMPDDEGFMFMHHAQRIKKREWMVVLGVKLEPCNADSDSSVPYFYELQLYGFFKVDSKFPGTTDSRGNKITPKQSDELIKARVEVNGPAMLYGIAREKIRSLSSSSVFREILIPTVSFQKAKEVEGKVAEPDSKPKPKRRPPHKKK